MAIVQRPAVEIKQGNLNLYLTYVTPQELADPGFYTVEKLDPQTSEGFQRLLNESRVTRLARHLRDAFDSGYANLPTTIFLAIDKDLAFDPSTNSLTFDTAETGPFSVVDGQHRIEGLVRAAKEQKGLANFQLPATIATALDDIHQMYHFYIVNTTQQQVERGLRFRITSRFTDMRGFENLPYFPHWMDLQVQRGSDAQARNLIMYLNDQQESPLRGRIQLANEPARRSHIVKEAGISTIFKRRILTDANPVFEYEQDSERMHRMMLNFFRAADSVFVDPDQRAETAIYNNNGIYFLATVSRDIFRSLYDDGNDFRVDKMVDTIKGALEELSAYHEMSDPQRWIRGQGNESLTRQTADAYAAEFNRALRRARTRRTQRLDEVQL